MYMFIVCQLLAIFRCFCTSLSVVRSEGLELPSSDVDVVVCGINGTNFSYGGSRAGYNGMHTVANLQKLANVLQEQSWVRGMKVRHYSFVSLFSSTVYTVFVSLLIDRLSIRLSHMNGYDTSLAALTR